MALKRFYITACSLIAVSVFSTSLLAADLGTSEKRKASFLLNFTRYANWHDETFNDSDQPINLCLSDTGSFRKFLKDKVKDKKFGPSKKAINIVNYSDKTPNDNCHLSYILNKNDAEKVKNNRWLKVGGHHDMANLGTAINFIEKEEEVRFEIYPSKLEQQGVTMSSELLKLATIIKE